MCIRYLDPEISRVSKLIFIVLFILNSGSLHQLTKIVLEDTFVTRIHNYLIVLLNLLILLVEQIPIMFIRDLAVDLVIQLHVVKVEGFTSYHFYCHGIDNIDIAILKHLEVHHSICD